MKKMRTIILVAALCGLSGCATTNKDPLEGINRGIYKFNDVADRYAMKPVAKAYKAVAPTPVRTGISNFFSNLGTLTTVVNDLLQLKFAQAFSDAGRFVINTTFGLAGFVDVASMDKIEKHNEDFGQTLGYWGVGSGAYLVLPILGPSSVRDAGGLVVDTITSDPITYLHNIGEVRTYNQFRAVQLLDKRTQLLDATDLVDNASIDPYAFMRDAYLQRRASQVQDGLVPQELLQDEFQPADDEPATPADKQSATPVDIQQSAVEPSAPAEIITTDAVVTAPAEVSANDVTAVLADQASGQVPMQPVQAEATPADMHVETQPQIEQQVSLESHVNAQALPPLQAPETEAVDATVSAVENTPSQDAQPVSNATSQPEAVMGQTEETPTQMSAVDLTLQALEADK